MPALALEKFMPAVRQLIDAETSADLHVYTRPLPPEPQIPYVVLQLYSPGYGWDEGLLNPPVGSAGFVGVQANGVGRAHVDATWALDQVRQAMFIVLKPDIEAQVPGVHIADIASEGPPTEPIEAGTLWTMSESYVFYLEAV